MLTELHIENFAIIDRLDIHFNRGFVIFTGETGAGKSIIIDAVVTLLGGRADSTMLRSDAERATIEGVFFLSKPIRPAVHRILQREELPIRPAVHRILQREELLDDPDYLTLSREIRLSGRNIARINGRSVSVALLREVGQFLVDVHGQSEHLSLLRVREHLGLLDSYANVCWLSARS